MRKTYVKPVMESEAFVANEYVAACYEYTFTCVTSDDWLCGWGGRDHSKSAEADSEAEAIAIINGNDDYYSETIRSGGSGYIHKSTGGFTHSISVNKTLVDARHPNASV